MRIVFIGTGAIGVATLRALLHAPEHEVIGVVTQPDKPVGRRQHTEAPPIKAELAKQSLPILQPRRLRDEESVAQIRELAPELIVVMAYGQILPESVLQIASIACLNVHASLLPKYRGAAPIQSAIAAGDTETGITIMYMDAGLDTGDILLQEKLTILPNETGGSLHDRLAQIAPDTLLNALAQLVNGHAAREPQDSARATYAAKLTRDDGKIDWSAPAEAIERKIRAYDPWPGAFTTLVDASVHPRHLKIFRASVVAQSAGPPGSVSTPNGSELVVATGRGGLRLDEVQLEGKRRLRAAEFLRGFSSPIPNF
jgi:methionyl-tRNA formyltransferase